MSPIIKPKALRRGGTIGVVAPAGPVNRERFDRALARVHERGFRTKTYGDIYRSRGYLAGDDATRAGELMAAFSDPEASAVWCARGGYGVVRLLDHLDYDIIRHHAKVFIGFSDITALHVAIHERTGLITFHGPNLQDGFGKPDDIPGPNESALWQAVLAENTGHHASGYPFSFDGLEGIELQALHPGVAQGRLTGGNLAVLAGLIGTPFELETAGRILFLEDVSERLYRIDRYLSQLRLAGKFRDVAGVLLGSFSYDEGDIAESTRDVRALITEFVAPLRVPLIAGFPAGHERYNLAMPLGSLVRINADAKSVAVLENPVASL